MEVIQKETTIEAEIKDNGEPAKITSFAQIQLVKRKQTEDNNEEEREAKIIKNGVSEKTIVSRDPSLTLSEEIVLNGDSSQATESQDGFNENSLSNSGSNFRFKSISELEASKKYAVDKVLDAGLWDKRKVKRGYSKYIATMTNKKLAALYKKARSVFWTEEQINFVTDSRDFETLNDKEKLLLKLVLSFFARSDGLVNENLVMNFYQKITIPEARMFYSFQINIEAIHAITYTILIETLVSDKKEKIKLLKDVDKYVSVAKKEAWVKKWIESGNSLAESLLAFVCVEGIFFSAAFCVIYWFKQYKKGLLKGLVLSNSFIARDERLHCEFGIELYKCLKDKLPQERVYEIFNSAIDCEVDFAREALKEPLEGMSSDTMIQYIKFVADGWLTELEYQPLYNVPNPYEWMALLEVPARGNFFECNNYQYTSGTSK